MKMSLLFSSKSENSCHEDTQPAKLLEKFRNVDTTRKPQNLMKSVFRDFKADWLYVPHVTNISKLTLLTIT